VLDRRPCTRTLSHLLRQEKKREHKKLPFSNFPSFIYLSVSADVLETANNVMARGSDDRTATSGCISNKCNIRPRKKYCAAAKSSVLFNCWHNRDAIIVDRLKTRGDTSSMVCSNPASARHVRLGHGLQQLQCKSCSGNRAQCFRRRHVQVLRNIRVRMDRSGGIRWDQCQHTPQNDFQPQLTHRIKDEHNGTADRFPHSLGTLAETPDNRSKSMLFCTRGNIRHPHCPR